MSPSPTNGEAFESDTEVVRHDLQPCLPDNAADLLSAYVHRFGDVLGAAELQPVERVELIGGDPADLEQAATGLDLETTVEEFVGEDLSISLIRGRHLAGGKVRGRHERLIVRRCGVAMCEVVVCTSLRQMLAGKGEHLDQARVRFAEDVDPALGALVTQLIEELDTPQSARPAPDADIRQVRLGGGVATGGGTNSAAIDWALHPTSLPQAQQCFEEYIQFCFEQFGLGAVPAFETTMTRTAAGADGQDGHSLLTRSTASTDDGRVTVTLSTVEVFWNDDDVDHVSIALDMRMTTNRLRVTANGSNGAACTRLRLRRPASDAAVEGLWGIFSAHLDAT